MRSMTRFLVLALGMAAGSMLLPAPAAATYEGFLKSPLLQGDSLDDAHKNEIELISYTQNAGNKACFKAIVIKNLDRASAALALFAVTEQRITPVTVTLRNTGLNSQTEPLVVVMEDVLVGSVELVEVDGAATPTERVVLLPRKATITFRGQDPASGQPLPPNKAVINCP